MTWSSRYWDVLEQLYWTPKYLGFRSLKAKDLSRQNGFALVPEAFLNESGSLYARERKMNDLMNWLHRQEETLNHVCSLGFSILPDQAIRELFLKYLGFEDQGPFETVGREVRKRYGWSASENVTQQDAFFVSERTALGVELKLGSSSSPEQIAKYAALFLWEELHAGAKEQVGLLFLLPEANIERHWASCGLNESSVDIGFLDRIRQRKLPSRIELLFSSHPARLESILSRMRLATISWAAFRDQLSTIRTRLDPSQPGDQTLDRLLIGILAQLEAHRGAGLDA
jgi:hypothetical protein